MMKSIRAIALLSSILAISGCAVSADLPDEDGIDAESISTAEQAVTNGVINAACAQSLTLRSSPGGSVIGTMYSNPDVGLAGFYVQSTSGSWSYGWSYAHSKWGYALASYLTSNYSQSGTPGQQGYHFSCCLADYGYGGGIDGRRDIESAAPRPTIQAHGRSSASVTTPRAAISWCGA